MKKSNSITLSFALLLLATIACGTSNGTSDNEYQSGWEKYTSNDGNYSTLFPANPTEETTTVNTAYGYVEDHSAKTTTGGIYYAVVFNELPASYLSETTAGDILDLSRNQMVDAVSGTLLYEKIISIKNYSGRELKIKISSNGETVIITARVFVVENKIYRIIVSTTEDDQFDSSINKFLDSFSLE